MLDLSNPQKLSGRVETANYGYLYLVLMSDGRMKVGITADTESRFRKLETSTGLKIKRAARFWVYAPAAAEAYLLKVLCWAREEGEWLDAGGAEHTERLFDDWCERLQAVQASELPPPPTAA